MCLSVSYWCSARERKLKSGPQLNSMSACICVAGRCETEPEAPGGAADGGTDEFSGPPDAIAPGTMSGACVPSGRLPHVQPHRGPLQ